MSSLTKSLEKRIQELTASIDAQKTQLIAYEGVLALEMAKENAPHEPSAEIAETYLPPASSPRKVAEPVAMPSSAANLDLSDLEFTGNKTNLVAAVITKFGAIGATPKEVDAVFTEHKVPRSKNLIYNTLSYLVARKRLVRKQGRYYGTGTAVKGVKKTAKVARTKRKLSADGIQRIRDANKKRWANQRAAEAATGAKKKLGRPAKKKSA